MKTIAIAAAGIAAMTFSLQAPAAGLGGVLGNTAGTGVAVLTHPVATGKNALLALPKAATQGGKALIQVVRAGPGVLTGGSIASSSTPIVVPLPGPGILNASLGVPDEVGGSLKTGTGPSGSVRLTVVTGR